MACGLTQRTDAFTRSRQPRGSVLLLKCISTEPKPAATLVSAVWREHAFAICAAGGSLHDAGAYRVSATPREGQWNELRGPDF
jgi:hypothetical protein